MGTQRPEVHSDAADETVITRGRDTGWLPGGDGCKDGYVVIGASWGERNWKAAVEMLGHPPWVDEPWFTGDFWDLPQLGIPKPDHADEVSDTIAAWCMERTRDEIHETGQAHGLTITGHATLAEVLENEQMRVRGFLREVSHPKAERVPDTAFPFRTSTIDSRRPGPAPQLGEHNEDVYRGMLGYEPQRLVRLRQVGVI